MNGPRSSCGPSVFPMKHPEPLRKTEEFKRVYHAGRSVADSWIVLYMAESDAGRPRLGISVSKKYGNSVQRHRFKRRIREIVRLREESLGNRDIVVIARNGSGEGTGAELAASFDRLAARLLTGKKR